MAPLGKLEVIEQYRILPSPRLPAPSSLPLTFFDIVFLHFSPVQRLYFYEYPHPTAEFLDSDLPNLKHSLSLCLHRFYPLAGNLIIDGENPEICCSKDDSVSLTIALSHDDFRELSGYHPRVVTDFHALVPPLVSSTGDKKAILAIQVTVFPNVGIAIGTTLHHAVADGSTHTHFMKTWASICNLRDNATYPIVELPFYDRAMVHESERLSKIYMNDLEAMEEDRSMESWGVQLGQAYAVRATFVFGRERLDKLRSKTWTGCCPYSLACGYMWYCLVRARDDRSKTTERFGFVTGCRARHDPPLPVAYFGNCLGICLVEVPRSELVKESGAAAAAEAIWGVICELPERVFARAESWIRDVFEYAAAKALTVGGSPKLGVYEVDFGWGRPRKVELISIERTGAISLAESRDEPGGIEVGIALSKDEMEKFASLFVDGFSDVS